MTDIAARLLLLVAPLALLSACGGGPGDDGARSRTAAALQEDAVEKPMESARGGDIETATFGAGCFWCVEVTSGYMGGPTPRPTYRQVCTGSTGHAEVVQVRFDRRRVAYAKLLEWFFALHDPTTLNQQGNDLGTQYRSVIFCHSEEQRAAAEAAKAAQDQSGEFSSPIVTEIAQASDFWPAEVHHQEYYRSNRAQPYCRMVIAPKLEKLGLGK
ncbi:MAG: peptide-methionine (S)-S-oxide reductase MsrA [Planctomycetes bacterium]|nr:peptide-methionine (S)-S-oxide reductase MsrA [Planctomycetota bacterium]